MGDLFLDSYSGESTAELLAMAGRYRVDSLVLAFEQALDIRVSALGAGYLTNPERTILAVEALEREVNNGGYWQFFVNSSREYADFIVTALEQIGCPVTAAVTSRAIDALSTPELTADSIDRVMGRDDPERDARLDECTSAYHLTSEPIEDRLFDFIRDHQAEIRLP